MYKYSTVTVVTDNGPYITKVILEAPEEIKAGSVGKDTFNAYVERKNRKTGEIFMASKTWMGPKIYPSKGYRVVTDVYPCDEKGNRTSASKTVAIEMAYGPIHPLGYAQASFGMMNEFVSCDYRITQVREIPGEPPVSGWVFDEFAGDICGQLKGWKNDKSTYAPLPLGYGYFTPDFEELRKPEPAGFRFGPPKKIIPEKIPLVIWLHGSGEGGEDPTVAYTGNKVVNLSSADIQNKLGGAAWILAPQSPTMWMDNGEKSYTVTGKSMYTEALKACIEEFVELHKEQIDTDRIYIGGCSNGGFMTMRMIVDYPTYFAAAYPVCEALYDNVISDQDIENIKHLPIWFTHAANDPVVRPETTVLPTFKRLRAAGGKNIHASYFDNVVDQSGLFKDELGRPFEYLGHFSWVHTYNDIFRYDMDGTRVMADGSPVTLWQWLGLQHK
jgi:predicted peptidase